MKNSYRIVGLNGAGGRVKLILSPLEVVKERLDPGKAIGDLGGFIGRMKEEAKSMNQTECICISLDEYKSKNYHLGDTVMVEVTS